MGHAMFDKFPLAAKALRGYQQTGYGVEISAFFLAQTDEDRAVFKTLVV